MPTKSLEEFDLEIFFAKHEFSAKYLTCCSDAESMKVKELIAMADEECLELWNDLTCMYTESNGMPLLRREIAKDYDGLDEDDIFCFSGAEEGIYTAMRVLLGKDDHAVIVTPCYQSLRSVAAAICEHTAVDLRAEQQWEIDFDRLESAIRANTKLIVVNFPHNPTGAYLTTEEQRKLVELCRKNDLLLFSDEVYRGIEALGTQRLPPLATIYEKGMSLGVMSKSLGLAGLRIGWIACKDAEIVRGLSGYKHYLSICNSAPSEVLALIALRNKEAILARNTEIFHSNLLVVEEFLKSDAGKNFSWTAPKAGCCGFMAFERDVDWEDIANPLVHDHGILTLPGKFFGGAATANHFRVGLARADFPQVWAKFAEVAKSL